MNSVLHGGMIIGGAGAAVAAPWVAGIMLRDEHEGNDKTGNEFKVMMASVLGFGVGAGMMAGHGMFSYAGGAPSRLGLLGGAAGAVVAVHSLAAGVGSLIGASMADDTWPLPPHP